MRVALIDYGSGNLRSAEKALARAAADQGLEVAVQVTDDPAQVRAADRILLPGVGAFATCMTGLLSRPGLLEALAEAVQHKGRPFLGVCVGMQLLADRGLEHGVHQGLAWIAGQVVKLQPQDPALKVPHMGWSEITARRPHALLAGLATSPHMYFVHSYQLELLEGADLVAEASYGGPVVAMVARDNVAGTQFHPEKSQAAGLRLLANFLSWKP